MTVFPRKFNLGILGLTGDKVGKYQKLFQAILSGRSDQNIVFVMNMARQAYAKPLGDLLKAGGDA